MEQRAQAVKSLSGELGVELWEENQRVALRQLFASKPPFMLRMDTLTPFDQPLVTVIYHRDLLAVHDRDQGRFAVGAADADHFEALTRVRIAPSEMSSLLSGQLPRLVKEGGEVSWDDQRGKSALTLSKDERKQVIYFDEETMTPRLMQLYDGAILLLTISLAEYTKTEPHLPQRMRVVVPKDKIKVELQLKEYHVNPELPEAAFKISAPPGMQVSEF